MISLIAPALLFANLGAPLAPDESLAGYSVDNRVLDTPVRSQGTEGTCTAFAVVASEEAEWAREWHLKPDLSERHLWSRYRQYQTSAAITAALQNKITSEEIWPYHALKPLRFPSPVSQLAASRQALNWVQVAQHLAAHKPAVLSVEVTHQWDYPDDGVISSAQGQTIGGHAIKVSGLWCRDDNRCFLILKNSWGTDWGDAGFAYLDVQYCATKSCYVHLLEGVK